MKIKDNAKDYADLKKAVELLETPSITAQISNLIGSPIEFVVAKLPKFASKKINGIVVAALNKSASAALWSLDNEPGRTSSTKTNKLYAAISGAAGGAFGFLALGIELPITTTIMMRAVADIARSEGFDLDDFDTKQACIEVFALGGNPEAAELAGIKTRWVTVKIFALMGMLCAIAAAISTARLNAATNAQGELDELYTIAAAVIGGTSLAGGMGTIAGAMLGALVMQSLQSGMVLVGIDTPFQRIVVGMVLVVAVWLDTIYRARAK